LNLHGKSKSGALLVLAIFVLGGIVLASLFYARRVIKPFPATSQPATQ